MKKRIVVFVVILLLTLQLTACFGYDENATADFLDGFKLGLKAGMSQTEYGNHCRDIFARSIKYVPNISHPSEDRGCDSYRLFEQLYQYGSHRPMLIIDNPDDPSSYECAPIYYPGIDPMTFFGDAYLSCINVNGLYTTLYSSFADDELFWMNYRFFSKDSAFDIDDETELKTMAATIVEHCTIPEGMTAVKQYDPQVIPQDKDLLFSYKTEDNNIWIMAFREDHNELADHFLPDDQMMPGYTLFYFDVTAVRRVSDVYGDNFIMGFLFPRLMPEQILELAFPDYPNE